MPETPKLDATLEAEDRKAMQRERNADIAYFVIVFCLLAGTLGAGIALVRGGLSDPLRILLSVAPPALAMLGGGVWGLRIKKFDERQKKLAYRGIAYGALGVCGMFTGAAAAWGIHQGDNDGLIVMAFCALPVLLLWAAFSNAFLLRKWR